MYYLMMNTNFKYRQLTMKGLVTKVNKDLFYFEVEHLYRVYIDVTKELIFIPKIGDRIFIDKSVLYDAQRFTAVMGHGRIYTLPPFNGLNECPMSTKNRLKTSKMFVCAEDVMDLDLIVRKLEVFFPDRMIKLAINALWDYLEQNTKKRAFNKFKKFKNIAVKVTEDLVFANSSSRMYDFFNFEKEEEFVVNCYCNMRAKVGDDNTVEYLFGILTIPENNKHFILQNGMSKIPVIISSPYEPYKLHNSLVLVTKYKVICQIYKDINQKTTHFLMLKQENIIVIVPQYEQINHINFFGECVQELKRKASYYFQPLKVSDIIYGYKNSVECWMEVILAELESSSRKYTPFQRVYIIIPNKLLTIAAFLKENIVYELQTDVPLHYSQISQYRELYGRRGPSKVIIIEPDSIVREANLPPFAEAEIVFEHFNDIQNKISKSSTYETVNFTLKIDKVLCRSVSCDSWFPARHNNLADFGDAKGQQILLFCDTTKNVSFKLYLSNRDNHLRPLGLIPNMVVTVRHAEIVKRSYLKTTVFTSFEIVDYPPSLEWSSANLYYRDIRSWRWQSITPAVELRNFLKMPVNFLVHGKLAFCAIFDINITSKCEECETKSTTYHHICPTDKVKLTTQIILHVQAKDSFLVIETFNENFLYHLLGFKSSEEIKLFTNECIQLKTLKINFLRSFEDSAMNNDIQKYPAIYKFMKFIKFQCNFKYKFCFDALCIRQGREKPYRLLDYRLEMSI